MLDTSPRNFEDAMISNIGVTARNQHQVVMSRVRVRYTLLDLGPAF